MITSYPSNEIINDSIPSSNAWYTTLIPAKIKLIEIILIAPIKYSLEFPALNYDFPVRVVLAKSVFVPTPVPIPTATINIWTENTSVKSFRTAHFLLSCYLQRHYLQYKMPSIRSFKIKKVVVNQNKLDLCWLATHFLIIFWFF